jgi:GT2 family glycosyltransferase/uncharacterized membrane protein YvlD (DUF360 family)
MSIADFVSIVIPSHNRRSAVSRLLEALAAQHYPLDRLEVIVVADGCTDDTCAVLSRYRGPLPLRVLQHPGGGPAAARNVGVAAAKGQWLLFLDDDVVPNPRLVRAHVDAQRRSPGSVVVGPYPPARMGGGLLDLTVQSWWRRTFEERVRAGHRHDFTSVLTGNLSIPADLLDRLGGFDPRFHAHEDYELGMRVITAGVPVVYERDALAVHHHSSDIMAYIKRKADEGRADVMLLERYPDLATELPLCAILRSSAWGHRVARAVAVRRLLPPRLLARVLAGPLYALDRAGLRQAWRTLKSLLETYVYLHAAADRLGGGRRVFSFCRSLGSRRVPPGELVDIDVGGGLGQAVARLDRLRPAAARIRHGSHVIGVIPSRPGSEPLRGAHLRAVLAGEMSAPLLVAMASTGAIVRASVERRRAISAAIQRQGHWFGPVRPGEMWREQYSQWQRFEQPEIVGEPTGSRVGDPLRALAALGRIKAALRVARRPLGDSSAFAVAAMVLPGFRIPILGELIGCALVFAAVRALGRPVVPYLSLPVVLLAVPVMLLLVASGQVWVTVLVARGLGAGIETSGVLSIVSVACGISAIRVIAAAAAAWTVARGRRLARRLRRGKRTGSAASESRGE